MADSGSDATVASLYAKVGFKVDKKTEKEVDKTINEIRANASRALGALGLGITLNEVRKIDEEFKHVNDSIRAMSSSIFDAIQGEITLAYYANDARMSYASMAGYATKMAQINPKLFGSVEEAAKEIEIVTKLGKAYGYSEGDIGSMQSTIAGLASQRVMSGGQIKSLESTAPELVKLIADAKGMSIIQLEAYANAGILSAKEIRDILLDAEDEINKKYEKIGITITDVMSQEKNSWGVILSETDRTLKISETVAEAIKGVSNKLKTIYGFIIAAIGPIISLLNKSGAGKALLQFIIEGLITILGLVTAIKAVDLASHVGEILTNVEGITKVLKPLLGIFTVSKGAGVASAGAKVAAGGAAAGGTAAAGGAAAAFPQVLLIILAIAAIGAIIYGIVELVKKIKDNQEKEEIKSNLSSNRDLIDYMMVVQDVINKRDREIYETARTGNTYYINQKFDTSMEFGGTNASSADIEKTTEDAMGGYWARQMSNLGSVG